MLPPEAESLLEGQVVQVKNPCANAPAAVHSLSGDACDGEVNQEQHEGCNLRPGDAGLPRAAIGKAAKPALARHMQRHKDEQIQGGNLTDVLHFTYMMVQEYPEAPALSGARHPSA